MAQNYSKVVLVTGSNGQLGSTLVEYLNDYYKVNPGFNMDMVLDVTNKNQLKFVIDNINPDYIVNCAAMTDVDRCEIDREKAYNVNVNGLKNLLSLTDKKTKIIHISTDYIFDGSKKFFNEEDLPNPLSYYGKIKLESENVLRSSNREYFILRTSVIYNDSHHNFYTWTFNSLQNNQEIKVVTDQTSNPTWTWSISEVIYKSMLNNLTGVFHYGGADVLSRYDFAIKIANMFNFDLDNIIPIKTCELKQTAKRPSISTLDSNKIKDRINIEHPSMDYIISTFKDRKDV